jgi:hypothetical protein
MTHSDILSLRTLKYDLSTSFSSRSSVCTVFWCRLRFSICLSFVVPQGNSSYLCGVNLFTAVAFCKSPVNPTPFRSIWFHINIHLLTMVSDVSRCFYFYFISLPLPKRLCITLFRPVYCDDSNDMSMFLDASVLLSSPPFSFLTLIDCIFPVKYPSIPQNFSRS